MKIIEIKNEEDIKNLTRDDENPDKLLVIDCGATWCGPCKVFGRFYEKFAETLSENIPNIENYITFSKLDADELKDFCQINKVENLPTILFIKNEDIVDRIIGNDQAKFAELIKNNLEEQLE